MAPMKPTIGRIVLYRFDENDVLRCKTFTGEKNEPRVGEIYPAFIVRVFEGNLVNLHIFGDGAYFYWATSRVMGDGNGQWHWPERVE